MSLLWSTPFSIDITQAPGSRLKHLIQWEYKASSISGDVYALQWHLNEFGKESWEAVHVECVHFAVTPGDRATWHIVLKRPAERSDPTL